ncbi:MAG: hypothetical protein LBQ16_04170, partial [Gracilibacteraceae bacterium]|nr:hypothetical protein [Gracilibacteraceae bacterium]
ARLNANPQHLVRQRLHLLCPPTVLWPKANVIPLAGAVVNMNGKNFIAFSGQRPTAKEKHP